eukprot:Hpha_TRINITY_DN16903_c5_g1::TRINITY_DN16903_c5_g1_i1::g.53580::m.53580
MAMVVVLGVLGACEYFLEGRAATCEDTADPRGGVTPRDATECATAAAGFTNPMIVAAGAVTEDEANWPKGCYITPFDNSRLYYNVQSARLSVDCTVDEFTPNGCRGVCSMGPGRVQCPCLTSDC